MLWPRLASRASSFGSSDLDTYLAAGGTLPELRAVVADAGIAVVNAIAFFRWADADDRDPQTRICPGRARDADARRAWLCGGRCAARWNVASVSLNTMAGHFAHLAELARGIGVEPYLEFWGRAHTLSRLSEAYQGRPNVPSSAGPARRGMPPRRRGRRP